MRYHIKQEEGVCEYTGKTAPVLIQLTDVSGSSSSWISREALQNAANLLSILENASIPALPPPVRAQRSAIQTIVKPDLVDDFPDTGVEETPVVRPKSAGISRKDQLVLKEFEQECTELAEDPPADRKGQQSGVPEWAIRDLIKEWKHKLSEPKLLSPVLQKIFGMPKDRIDLLLS